MPQVKPEMETFAKIKVVGVGGSGGSAVNRMVAAKIRGVDFVVLNTDVQALHHSTAPQKLHIGKSVTRGLGAGMDPEVGRKAAEESQNEIREILKDSDMVFITCGLGGGTGSGASSVVAEVARELGALTVAVVTKPFGFEGPKRRDVADAAWEKLARNVDAIITIPNDRILQVIDKKTTLLESFKIVDDVLRQGVQGISEIITTPSLINVDFADVKTIMKNTGSALMGIGTGTGDSRAVDAAKITTSSAAEDARVIFGATIDENMTGSIRITVIASGFDERQNNLANNEEEAPSFFSANKFTNTNFLRRAQKEEEEEEKKFKQFTQKPIVQPPVSTPSPVNYALPKEEVRSAPMAAPKLKADDELEIPAFIRKKMGI